MKWQGLTLITAFLSGPGSKISSLASDKSILSSLSIENSECPDETEKLHASKVKLVNGSEEVCCVKTKAMCFLAEL